MEPTEPNPPAKGVLTSEFWLTVLGVVALIVLVLHDDIDGTWAAGAIAFATLGYNASRAVVKSAQVSGDAKVTGFKTDLALYALKSDASPSIQETAVAAVTEAPPAPVKPKPTPRKR